MRFVNNNFKFSGMRKEQEFTIYPCQASDSVVLLQSDKRIIKVDLGNGHALLSANKSNGALKGAQNSFSYLCQKWRR